MTGLHVPVALDTAGITIAVLGALHDYRRTRRTRRSRTTVARLLPDSGRATVHHHRRTP